MIPELDQLAEDIGSLQNLLNRVRERIGTLPNSSDQMDPLISDLAQTDQAIQSLLKEIRPSPEPLEEEHLRISEEHKRHKALLEAIFEADPGALAVLVGDELRFKYVNPAYRYMIPNPTQDPIGLPFDQVWPQRSKYNNRDHFRQVLSTGQPFQYHGFQHSYPDGTCRSFTLQARRINWGDEAAVLVILWDITELKEAENQLRSIALFLEQNPNPVLRLDLDGRVLYANPASRQLLPEYQPGESISDFWQAIVKGTYQRGENRLIDFEYTDRAYVFHVVPIPEAGYINLYGRDITERKQSAQALAAAHLQNQSIIDNTPDIVYALDLDERFILANIALADLLHTTPEQMIGKKRHEFMPKGDADWHEANDQQVVAAGKALEFEEYSQLNGRSITWLTKKFPLLDAQGNIYAVAGISADISERKRIEAALQESNQKYQELVRYAPAGIYEVDFRTRRYTTVNDVMCELTGYTRDELLTMDAFDLLDEAGQKLFQERIQQWLAGEKPTENVEYKAKTKDGRLIDTLLSVTFRRDEAGKPAGATVVAIDITARKKAEDTLRESQMLLRAVIENTQDPVYVKDRQSRILLANQALAKMIGKPIEDIVGKTDSEYYDNAEIGQALRENDLKVMESGASLSTEETVKTVEGWRTFLSAKAPYRDPVGHIIGIVGISRDITERKQAEVSLEKFTRQLQETQNYLENLFNYANAPIIVWDPEYTITRFNHAFEHLTGYSAEEVLGKKLDLLFDSASREESLAKISRTTSGEYWESVEIPIRRKDGENRIALWNSANIYADDGKTLQATIAQGQDITERKKAEAESQTRRLQIELQRRLLDQREQDRLEIARDLHDGPLQEITAAALALQGLILDCPDTAQLATYDAIQASLQTASSELRGYAQELRSPVLSKFGLEKAIQAHLESIQEKHPELSIHFETTHYEDLLSQPVRLTLYRIYQQALTNIFKHSGANQVTIHLVKTLDDVTLRIQDNGSGFEIPDDWLELARTGHLGLVGMRERAEAIGGTFIITSTPTSGTTIQVTVPI